MNAAERLLQETRKVWAPPPAETLSQWAEANFVLSPEYSPQTGPLRLFGFQRGILDSFTDPYVSDIVVMSATQLVKTLFLQTAVAYVMARDPGPILFAQPTETDVETFSKERLAPMIRDMACLNAVVAPDKKTSSTNTTLHKVFRGGSLSLIGAQTAGNFARRSIRYFFADERDKWKKNVGKEGDGYSLGVRRTANFRSRAKRAQVCSPTVDGDSQIADAYEASDQRKFWVACPHCGEAQVLAWAQVVWEESDPYETTRYKCSNCEALWTDVERWAACEVGEWRADKKFDGTAGFWISELYSPWRKLGDLVRDYLAKKDDASELQTFVNTSLAETWREKGDAPDYEKLMSRREEYRLGQVPQDVLFLTAGFDTQKTWVEGYIYGWGRGRQRWVIDHFRLDRSPFEDGALESLDEVLNRSYRHPSGADLAIVRLAIDSGFATQEVYRWARRHPGRVIAVDGRVSGVALVGTPSSVDVATGGRKIKAGCKIWPVNVSMAKAELYGLLSKDRPADGDPFPAGWVHFAADLDEEFFRQLTAEQLIARVVKGYRKYEWSKTRERNEALDCANYARAAAEVFGISRFSESRWRDFEAQVERSRPPDARQQAPSVVAQVQQQTPQPQPVPQQQRSTNPGWFGNTGDWFSR